ncbi:translocon-associated protein subunit delta-like [Liolophura sinensis]|uniref:translocon-associated protein subunit delta-like n=1 Tax=Liolophura sinensis TaxID=3198878 RepID=UPI003158B342
MAATMNVVLLLSVVFPALVFGSDVCSSPDVQYEVYTTPETVLSSETIFIIQFKLNCKNGAKNLNLYAEINGKTIVATKSVESNTYQISISDEHKNLPAGSYPVRLFDEDGYAVLRKAQRSGEDTSNIKVLKTITLQHKGLWTGPYVQSEFVAAGVAVLVWYLAYAARGKLQTN